MSTAHAVVIQAKQLDGGGEIVFGPNPERDPSRVRQHMVCVRTTGGD